MFTAAECRRGWVPIFPDKVYCEKTSQTREMVPLRLSSAWTPWKAQGETMRQQIVFDPGTKEKTGMTYTALSRARSIRQIGIDGINEARFTSQIANNAGLKRRVVEQKRLAKLAEETMKRWPLPPDDESVAGSDGGGGGGDTGTDSHEDEVMSVVSIDESLTDAAESDDEDMVENPVKAQPQQPQNEAVPANNARDDEMDESDDDSLYYDPLYYQPNGRRRRGGARVDMRRQRAGEA